MRRGLFIFFLMTACFAKGQVVPENHKVGQGRHRFSFGLTVSPDFSCRFLKNHGGDSITDKIIQLRNENESALFSYSAGINGRMDVSSFLGLKAGIKYSKYGFQMTGISVTDELGESIPGASAKSITQFHYLSVPVSVIFSYGKEKWKMEADAGIDFSYLFYENEKVILNYADSSRQISRSWDYPYNRFNLFPFLGIGCEYHFNHLFLSAGPVFRLGILKLSDTSVRTYLWNAGFRIGVYYCL